MNTIGISVDLDRLEVLDENEGSPDEPYLWPIYIKVDGTTLKVADLAHSSATLHAPFAGHGGLGPASDDMEEGDSVAIPDAIGRWQTTLSTVDGLPVQIEDTLSSVAVLLVALEEDATKGSAIEAGRQKLVSVLQAELNNAIRAGLPPDAGAIGATASKAVAKAIKDASISVFSFMPITSLLDIGGIIDPDDFVGQRLVGPFTMRQITEAGSGGLAFDAHLNGNDEGSYKVTGRIRRTFLGQPFGGAFRPGKGGQHFVAGLEFKPFVDLWIKLGKQSPPVDLIDVETYVENGTRRFAGVFSPGKGGQHFVAGLEFKPFVDLWIKLGKQSPPVDLIDVETYVENGTRRFAGVFSPGKGGQHFVSGLEFKPFVDLWKKLGSQSPPVDLIDVETYVENGTRRFAGVFSPGKGGQHFVSGLEFKPFVDLWKKLGSQSPPVDLIDVETYVENGTRRFAGVFSPGKGGQHFVSGLEFKPFVDLWKKLGSQSPPVDLIDLMVG